MVGSSALECQRVRVLDADGSPLTAAMTRAEEADGAVQLSEVEDSGILIHYYFGRGQRQIMMEFTALPSRQMIAGTLETRWIGGERVWQVYVDRSLVTLGPVHSAEAEPVTGRQ